MSVHRRCLCPTLTFRYDQYIETDSEGGYEVGENVSVARLAESCLLLTLGPITGLLGLSKIRKDEPKNVVSPDAYAELEDRETAKLWSTQQELLVSVPVALCWLYCRYRTWARP